MNPVRSNLAGVREPSDRLWSAPLGLDDLALPLGLMDDATDTDAVDEQIPTEWNDGDEPSPGAPSAAALSDGPVDDRPDRLTTEPDRPTRPRTARLGVRGVPSARRVPQGRKTRHSRVRYLTEWFLIIVAALTIALTVRATMVQAFFIPSESMVPTLKIGDRLLVDKIGYRMHDVHRGDIVVFRRPPNESNKSINDLIKRVVGLPGDTVEAIDGKVYINSQPLPEKYLPPGTVTVNMPRQVIPVDNYWVMGDNRGNSADSRVFGPIDRKLIVGRAFLRVFPVTKVGRL